MRLPWTLHLDPGRPTVLPQRPERGLGRLSGLHQRRRRPPGHQHPGHPHRVSWLLWGPTGEQMHVGNGEAT